MTREIKFRAWDKVLKFMFNPDEMSQYITFEGRVLEIELAGYWGMERVKKEDRTDTYDLMQFTGLKDKNGVKIYEGDIVSFIDHKEPQTTERTGVVRYREWSASYVIRTEFFAYNDWINYSCKVIGNIYEHPELIKTESE